MIRVRDMQLIDAEAINLLNTESLGYDISIEITKKQMEKLLINPNHHIFYIAEEEELVVGYVHAELYETLYSEPMLNVLALAVNQTYQKKGIGKQLMQKIEQAASERDLVGVRLNSGETRTGAHKFYESIGYSSDKNQKRFLKII
ncbi:GNAT family N-acetyltransferase [Carnobacterium viridans]|uniref:Ribosomal protein S18 acetylase RimI n=1 Tax=Carnobacterium viridans TaxID=174587 RepID=A0A1H0ZIP9_9LACT|nr:GNAT family N-acetyltransferase [Carnobacterium viridans]SDQ27242.1 Ribosomal protein S18 acetylase RimI [Carnobacterium viridans]